jgi:DNA-binding NarL/FixJ family response regulator
MTRVLIVDDHPFLRLCLVDLIGASDDLEVVGECADGSEVLAAVGELRPDVVLMDVRMPQLSGLDTAAALQHQQPQVKVVILTSDVTRSSRATAHACGVADYLLKTADPHSVLDSIRRVTASPGGAQLPSDLIG